MPPTHGRRPVGGRGGRESVEVAVRTRELEQGQAYSRSEGCDGRGCAGRVDAAASGAPQHGAARCPLPGRLARCRGPRGLRGLAVALALRRQRTARDVADAPRERYRRWSVRPARPHRGGSSMRRVVRLWTGAGQRQGEGRYGVPGDAGCRARYVCEGASCWICGSRGAFGAHSADRPRSR